ncbi:MAG: PrsW family intramembrane metalloprotease [Planctomycetota bacterium]
MDWILLLGIAVAPVWILVHGAYVVDRYEREPIRNMLRYVGWGAAICIPAAAAEFAILKLMGVDSPADTRLGIVSFLFVSFIGIALVEEAGKRAMLQWSAHRDHNIDEPFDWIVYAVSISMGFALFENILYVFTRGAMTGVMRAFTAVPEHALLGTLMGERLARAALLEIQNRNDPRIRWQRLMSIVEPTIWHGLYDCLLFQIGRSDGESEAMQLFCVSGVFVLIISQWVVVFIRVRQQQRHAHFYHRVPPVLIWKKLM